MRLNVIKRDDKMVMSENSNYGREYCVYMHTTPNGKRYIGQTKQKPSYRFQNGSGYKGCTYFYSAITKYGWDNIKHEILIDGVSSDEADYYEKYYIDLYQTNDKRYGYNLRTGGTSGYIYTDEAKQKMSEKQKGKKQSEETRRKHSEALLKYYQEHTVSEETREKLRQAGINRPVKHVSHDVSPETRAKTSEALKPYQFKKGHAPSEKSMKTLREKLSKKVIQYDLNMNAIAEYPSITVASKAIGATVNCVGNCVRGYAKTAGGYIWRYA